MSDNANIGQLERLATQDLNIFHKNARRGDVETIMESMKHHGVYKPLVVNRGTHTGRANEVLCGNHSLMAMRRLADENPRDSKWQHVDVYMVDVDEDQAKRLVLVDNRSSDKADYDVEELVNLATELPDLEATGFTRDELDAMLDSLDSFGDDTLPDDLPTSEDSLTLLVECDNPNQRDTLKAKLLAEGYNVGNA